MPPATRDKKPKPPANGGRSGSATTKQRKPKAGGRPGKTSGRNRHNPTKSKRQTQAFDKVRRRGGLGVAISVIEGVDGALDERAESFEVVSTKVGALPTGARLKRGLSRAVPALAALGHVQRARIMAKLLEGPATYRALQDLTHMKAGPLYYHINELRSAGLVRPKQRDLYELTRGGRNVTMVAAAVASMVKDSRRRPIGAAS